jgi:septal ring factor EnvC (AmiA/AmiB activator)
MSKLFAVPLLFGFGAFLLGWVAAKFSANAGARADGTEAPDHHRAIRALEASLRVARKDAEATTEMLVASTQELETLQASLNDMEQTAKYHEDELEDMRETVKSESKKVVELRRTLTDHAEETIRANASARNSDTELSLLKAGASVMYDEVGRLETEREELTNRLKALSEEPSGDPDADEPLQDGIQADQHMSDC